MDIERMTVRVQKSLNEAYEKQSLLYEDQQLQVHL